METRTKIYQNIYQDSVALMRISATISDMPGIEQASGLMGTTTNLDLLLESGLLDARPNTKPSDLLFVIKGKPEALDDAFTAAEIALAPKESSESSGGVKRLAPTSLLGALEEAPMANLALISTPGEFAAAEAMKALRAGLNVLLFSDNISVEQEIILKKYAAEKSLLFMGPDCGTAIISGVPLAFANVVRQGNIGIIGASGTGIQQVSSLIDQLGSGVSHAIGTGGHDLSKEVGGLTMLAGIHALANDPQTKVITLISKPPAKEVADKVLAAASKTGKPIVVNFLGADASQIKGPHITAASTLEEAAHRAVALDKGEAADFTSAGPDDLGINERSKIIARTIKSPQRYLRGLYTGGTFCYEAQLLLQNHLSDICSNGPVGNAQKMTSPFRSEGHTVIDLGDDVFTRGKPHPMIDPTPRNERILQEANDPETAVILLDVVLGYGSHDDPAGELAKTIGAARTSLKGSGPAYIASICGTVNDPQNLADQKAKLEAEGVTLCASNAEAVILALQVVKRSQQ
ncbi:acyl-CoA synthetase FdrA [Sneathiella sp. CAU 1612]|uniref:Acyl-CoA synthetase FdrA n=1 Tax=Sneathiella sedimenti TaxID=2816034 RepID=A0ABS3F6K9_9PROT|nr:acyl-CoA synthetase FdrA [Sneathiella sedimenti]MBO0333968.1 acyl-CoA synthetase FdrA [Sneathiella sedimenti]